MKTISAILVSGVMAATVLSTAISPAIALGGCGPNMHRGPGGRCYWGGQNQAWCLRHTGHPAVRVGGEMICYR
jgi:hypothetical protein